MTVKISFLLVIIIAIISCNLVGGAGGIKAYQYPVTKFELEKAVDSLIKNNTNIQRDTVDNYYTYVDSNKQERKIHDNYYNDGIGYLTLNIVGHGLAYQYIIRYYGDTSYWRTSANSEIFIVYANGYSAGYSKISRKLKKEITGLFESEFIDKLDKQLGKAHTVDPD